MDNFTLRLAKLVQRAYDPAFDTDPHGVDITDLGFTPAEILWATDPGGDSVPYGIIATDNGHGTVVALRGTESGVEWAADADAMLVSCNWAPGCLVHKGFYQIAETLRTSKGVFADVALSGGGFLSVAGHSLGAALATILATRMSAKQLVSLAGPRSGCQAFAALGLARIGLVARLVIPGDVVPTLPPPFPLPFRHVGDAIELQKPAIRDTLECRHSIATYLNAMDPSLPLGAECVL